LANVKVAGRIEKRVGKKRLIKQAESLEREGRGQVMRSVGATRTGNFLEIFDGCHQTTMKDPADAGWSEKRAEAHPVEGVTTPLSSTVRKTATTSIEITRTKKTKIPRGEN